MAERPDPVDRTPATRSIAVVGLGAVGARVARILHADGMAAGVLGSLSVADADHARAASVRRSLGDGAQVLGDGGPTRTAGRTAAGTAIDCVVVCTDADDQPGIVARWIGRARRIVTTTDAVDAVEAVLALSAPAARAGTRVLVGAGFSPGVATALAVAAAARLDAVDEIHAAALGTGGPACARQHHRALRRAALDYRAGAWVEGRPGSGRELLWFPDPVGPHDCYRAELAEPLLVHRAIPGLSRITARVSATRRDRLSAPLPMLRRPHPEGLVGAVRVEARGATGGRRATVVLGAVAPPARGAAACAAAAALLPERDDAPGGPGAGGAAGCVEVLDAGALLRAVAPYGVSFAEYAPDPV